MTPLTEADRTTALPALGTTGWRAVPDRDAIRKILKFRSFSEAWGFMARVALAAEKADHHPEWMNRYNVVDITLITHACGGLSDLDLALARRIDALAAGAAVDTDHSAPVDCLCEVKHRA